MKKKLYTLPMALLTMLLVFVGSVSTVAADNFECRGKVGPITVDNLVVPDRATCTLTGTKVEGNIIVLTGGRLNADRVSVDGNIQAEGHATVKVTNSTVGGSVQIKQGRDAQVIATRINGDLQLEQNTGKFRLNRNTIGGNLQANQNSGSGLEISRNVINSALQCQANSPVPTGGRNQASSKEDQCTNL